MYGVPSDLPLQAFVGREFNQVALGRFQTQFHSSGTGSIYIEGRWELQDASGVLIDGWVEHDRREAYRLHAVIDVPIVGFEVDPPRSFTIVFHSGHRLSVFDETPQYEAFSIQLDGQPPVYV